jgi:hypothetical protein
MRVNETPAARSSVPTSRSTPSNWAIAASSWRAPQHS